MCSSAHGSCLVCRCLEQSPLVPARSCAHAQRLIATEGQWRLLLWQMPGALGRPKQGTAASQFTVTVLCASNIFRGCDSALKTAPCMKPWFSSCHVHVSIACMVPMASPVSCQHIRVTAELLFTLTQAGRSSCILATRFPASSSEYHAEGLYHCRQCLLQAGSRQWTSSRPRRRRLRRRRRPPRLGSARLPSSSPASGQQQQVSHRLRLHQCLLLPGPSPRACEQCLSLQSLQRPYQTR